MDTLVTHLTLVVLLGAIGRLLALLTRPAQETVPHEALDEGRVQIHTLAVDQLVALSALQRVVGLSHVSHSLLANLALFGVEHGKRLLQGDSRFLNRHHVGVSWAHQLLLRCLELASSGDRRCRFRWAYRDDVWLLTIHGLHLTTKLLDVLAELAVLT